MARLDEGKKRFDRRRVMLTHLSQGVLSRTVEIEVECAEAGKGIVL